MERGGGLGTHCYEDYLGIEGTMGSCCPPGTSTAQLAHRRSCRVGGVAIGVEKNGLIRALFVSFLC